MKKILFLLFLPNFLAAQIETATVKYEDTAAFEPCVLVHVDTLLSQDELYDRALAFLRKEKNPTQSIKVTDKKDGMIVAESTMPAHSEALLEEKGYGDI